MATTADEQRFEKFLSAVAKTMPDAESAEGITTGFRAVWNKPPLEALELLAQRTYNLSQIRQLLFWPEPVDMLVYVAMIAAPPKGAPPEHPQNRTLRPFLSLLYMRHVRSWTLMREFIREGGLFALSELFLHDNEYLRAQAVDTFMQLTSTELHDWFNEPSPLEPAVHKCFLDLAGPSCDFVNKLEANMGPKSPFPGGSYYCLQILAFWLSLLRYFYCEQRVLRLGTHLMALLRKWAALKATWPHMPEEEAELAKKLVEDFERFPTVDAMHGQLIGAAGLGKGQKLTPEGDLAAPTMSAVAEEEAADDTASRIEEMDVSDNSNGSAAAAAADTSYTEQERIQAKPLSSSGAAEQLSSSNSSAGGGGAMEVEKPMIMSEKEEEAAVIVEVEVASEKEDCAALKQLGNAAFGKGELEEAITLYGRALGVASPQERHLLLGNRSAAHLKAAAKYTASGNAAEAERAAEAAAADAREAVRLNPSFTKGHYRLGSALLSLNKPSEAVTAIEVGLSRAPHNDELRAALRTAREAQEKARREALKAAKEGKANDAPAAAAAAVPLTSKPQKQPAAKVDYEAAAQTAARASALSQQAKAGGAVGGDPAAGGGDAAVSAEIPTTAQQFVAAWSGLKASGSLDQQRAWLSKLPAGSYANLFKESLSEGTMVELLQCAASCAKGAEAGTDDGNAVAAFGKQVLAGLASTRRFELTLMFLDGKQKGVVKSLFGELKRLTGAKDEALARKWEQ